MAGHGDGSPTDVGEHSAIHANEAHLITGTHPARTGAPIPGIAQRAPAAACGMCMRPASRGEASALPIHARNVVCALAPCNGGPSLAGRQPPPPPRPGRLCLALLPLPLPLLLRSRRRPRLLRLPLPPPRRCSRRRRRRRLLQAAARGGLQVPEPLLLVDLGGDVRSGVLVHHDAADLRGQIAARQIAGRIRGRPQGRVRGRPQDRCEQYEQDAPGARAPSAWAGMQQRSKREACPPQPTLNLFCLLLVSVSSLMPMWQLGDCGGAKCQRVAARSLTSKLDCRMHMQDACNRRDRGGCCNSWHWLNVPPRMRTNAACCVKFSPVSPAAARGIWWTGAGRAARPRCAPACTRSQTGTWRVGG